MRQKPWWEDIEKAVIRRETWQNRSTILNEFQERILKYELKALKKPYSTYIDIQEEWFVNSIGEWERERTDVVRQHETWIKGFILKELGPIGRFITEHQLDAMLTQVTETFKAAEYQTLHRPLIQLPLPHFDVQPKILTAS